MHRRAKLAIAAATAVITPHLARICHAAPSESSSQDSRYKRWEKSWARPGTPRFHSPRVNKALTNWYHQLVVKPEAEEGPSSTSRDECTSPPAKPKTKVLVPLCGKTHDLRYLRDEGHYVVGVEFVEKPIHEFAETHSIEWHRHELEEGKVEAFSAPNLAIWKGDFFEFADKYEDYIGAIEGDLAEPRFEYCWDRAALVAIEPARRAEYAATLGRLCDRVLLEVVEYDESKMDGAPYSVTQESIEEHFSDYFNIQLLERKNLVARKGPLGMWGQHDYAFADTYLLTKKPQAQAAL